MSKCASLRPTRGKRQIPNDIAYRLGILGTLIKMADTDVAGPGYIMHRYVEAKSGRLYAKGVSLQTAPKLIKAAALHGLSEYDFENCHYSIFAQMAERFGYRCEAIGHYLAHKRQVREGIARRVGITQAHTKKCLLALLYNAPRTVWRASAVPQAIGVAAAERLYRDHEFADIGNDINKARTLILRETPKRPRTLLNAAGKSISLSAEPKEILAHLMQGVEAAALRRVLELYPQEVVLLMHDGWVCTAPVDVELVQREVLAATGYSFELAGGDHPAACRARIFQNVRRLGSRSR